MVDPEASVGDNFIEKDAFFLKILYYLSCVLGLFKIKLVATEFVRSKELSPLLVESTGGKSRGDEKASVWMLAVKQFDQFEA